MSDNILSDRDKLSNNIDFLDSPEGGVINDSSVTDRFVGGSSGSFANYGRANNDTADPMLSEEMAGEKNGRLGRVRELLKDQLKKLSRPKEANPEPTVRKLGPDEKVKLELDYPHGDKNECYKRFGINGRWIADITASSKTFHIIDVRDNGVNHGFRIIDDSYKLNSADEKGIKGVSEFSGPVKIGRKHHADRFEYPATVSGDHFQVEYSVGTLDGQGELIVTNLNPTNPTFLIAYVKQPEGTPVIPSQRVTPQIEDDRTALAESRLKNDPRQGESDENAPYGYHLNHPKLGRKSVSVDDGVYLGGSAREAIWVNGESEVLKKVYEELAQELRTGFKDRKTATTQIILIRVRDKVREVMPYDGPKTTSISQDYYGDKLAELSMYVNERAGVCRHQALLAAYLTEMLINEGFLRGGIGVERNTVEDYGGTHAWAVFKPEGGKPEDTIVIDPSQPFVGTKAQAERENRWAYRLSTDKY